MIFQIYFSDLEVGRCKEASNLQKVGELIGVNMVLLDKKVLESYLFFFNFLLYGILFLLSNSHTFSNSQTDLVFFFFYVATRNCHFTKLSSSTSDFIPVQKPVFSILKIRCCLQSINTPSTPSKQGF